jgi:membrane dipeptidase
MMVKAGQKITNKCKEILEKAIIVNGCEPQVYWEIRKRRYRGEKGIMEKVLFPIFNKGGISAIAASIYVPFPPLGFWDFKDAIRSIGVVNTDIEESKKTFLFADNYAKIEAAKRRNKIAVIYFLQGLPPLEGELYYLGIFFKLGVRIIQLTYNERNDIGDGCFEKSKGKLSNFGIEVVRELNRLGILIDLTHVGENSFYHVIEISNSPVVVSHSNCKRVCNHIRNLSDEQICAVVQTGGVVGINAFPYHVKRINPSIKNVLDHIDHIVNLVGEDYVGLGLDLSYYTDEVGKYPDLYIPPSEKVKGLETPAQIPNIIQGLIERGHSRKTIMKILGENFLRVYKCVFA